MQREKKHVIIIGFMGTGKTTVGKSLAASLQFPWIDTDDYFEQQAGQSISSFFQLYGENTFREQEAKILKLCLKRETSVITTGGGIVLRQENREHMKRDGWVICLTAKPEEIIRRCLSQDLERPLIQGDITKKVRQLFQERQGLYDFADLIIDTTDRSISQVVTRIESFWKSKQV